MQDLLYSQKVPVTLRGHSPNIYYSQSNATAVLLKICHILEAPGELKFQHPGHTAYQLNPKFLGWI